VGGLDDRIGSEGMEDEDDRMRGRGDGDGAKQHDQDGDGADGADAPNSAGRESDLDDFDLEDCAQFDSADGNEGDFGGVPVINPFLTPSSLYDLEAPIRRKAVRNPKGNYVYNRTADRWEQRKWDPLALPGEDQFHRMFGQRKVGGNELLARTHIRVHARTQACICACVHICIFACIPTCMRTYTCTYENTHTQTHTLTKICTPTYNVFIHTLSHKYRQDFREYTHINTWTKQTYTQHVHAHLIPANPTHIRDPPQHTHTLTHTHTHT